MNYDLTGMLALLVGPRAGGRQAGCSWAGGPGAARRDRALDDGPARLVGIEGSWSRDQERAGWEPGASSTGAARGHRPDAARGHRAGGPGSSLGDGIELVVELPGASSTSPSSSAECSLLSTCSGAR
jgi:hypothetical protein